MGMRDWLSDWARFEGGSNDLIENRKQVKGRSQHTEIKHYLKVASEDTCNYMTA